MPDPDYKALCAELLQAVDDDVIDVNDGQRFQAVVDRARAALAQPEPQGPKLIYRYSPVTIAECGGPCEQGPEYCDCGEIKGEPEPQGPTDEELDELWAEIDGGGAIWAWQYFARAVLARWGTPANKPGDGEIDEEAATVIPWLLENAARAADADQSYVAGKLTLAAQLLGERRPANNTSQED